MHQNCETIELLLQELRRCRAFENALLARLDELSAKLAEYDKILVQALEVIEENIDAGRLLRPIEEEKKGVRLSWN